MEKQKYASINGLRAISISLVILHHLVIQKYIPVNFFGINFLKPFAAILQDGQLGVNVFFVISGFLITSLMQQEEINSHTISLKNFYIRRVLLIFPTYFFLLFFYFSLQLLNLIQISTASWITALTYTKYLNWRLDWFTAHAWSLSIEENFYIFWPLIFMLGNKSRKTIAIFLILIVPLIRTYIYFHPINWINELSIFMRIDSIAIGCLFALYKDDILKRISPYWTKLFYFSILTLLFLPYLPTIANKIHLGSIFIPLGLTHGTIANILVALVMMYSVFGPKGIWFKLLNLKVIHIIGLLSYSIYLWQQIFFYKSKYWITQFPQNIFLILLVAACSYYFIEKPFLKLKSKFSEK